MSGFLSALPILSVLAALCLGIRSLPAAIIGIAAAMLAIFVAFPVGEEAVTPAMADWSPVLVEVLLIIGGGLLLSEVLRHAGAQAELAGWIRRRAGRGVGAVLLVVHGITPFSESLTGFGIGVTIAIPLLAHFGLSAPKVAVIGLLGLCAVPWGSMGPGTLIAATMADLSFHDLGVISAIVSIVPFTVTGMVAAWLASSEGSRAIAVMQGAVSGLMLTISVTLSNIFFGTPPAGALGALVVIAVYLLRKGEGRFMVRLARSGRKALSSYAVLLGGVLVAGWLVRAGMLPESWRYIASPAFWLFVAAFWFSTGLPDIQPLRRTWAAWLQVAPVTGLFIVLGVLMAVSGMATFLAEAMAGAGAAYLAGAPFVGALGGFVTGSNSGANAMFATTQAEIARSLGVDVLWFMAVHNVAASFLLMASPGKIELAVQLSPENAGRYRGQVQMTILAVAFAVVVILAALNLMLLGTLRSPEIMCAAPG